VANNLSCLQFEQSVKLHINDYLKDDTLLKVSTTDPGYKNIVNYIVAGYIPPGADKKKIIRDSIVHLWDGPYMYRMCSNGLHRRCVPTFETRKILECCHSSSYGGHYRAFHTNANVWQSGFYWPTMYDDATSFIRQCVRCQKHENINARDAMPLTTNLQVDIFDVWGIDFMGSFPKFEGCKYILVTVNYASKWVEALPCQVMDALHSKKMIHEVIFPRFGVPLIIIIMEGHTSLI
jgi:hypothetical protein